LRILVITSSGISRREIEKVALGTNYKMVAFKRFNDPYLAGGAEYAKLSEAGSTAGEDQLAHW
jgi:hypothetical protein